MPKSQLQQAQEAINNQIRDFYLELDDQGNFLHPPSIDDELDEFIRVAYGIKVPRKVITPGHKAPFHFIADLFFERVKNALGFASRAAGKTFSVALLNHLDMIFKPKCEIASAGAVLTQADKCYRYFREFNQQLWFRDLSERYRAVTGTSFYDERLSLKSYTQYGNGAYLEIITGSEKGLRSPHPHKARIDEIDLIEWDVLQTGLSMAHSGPNIRGQNVFTSTRQLAQGSMQALLDAAAEKGIEVYEWNIWEILEKCPRRCMNDPEFGDCSVHQFCQGRAHHCEGFFKIDDFIDKVRLIDRDKFETEWLNKKPSRHRLVYHMFETSRHIMTPERLFQKYRVRYPDPAWYRIGGVDFGAAPGHPFVYLQLVQLPDGAWLIYFEYIAEQRLIRDHAKMIKSSPMWRPNMLIFADWDAQDRLELKSAGVPTKRAIKGPSSVNMGIDYISELLNGYPPKFDPRLYVWHECSGTAREWGIYSWPVGADGKPDRRGNPEKRYDHTSDATRMALFSLKRRPTGLYRGRNISGI